MFFFSFCFDWFWLKLISYNFGSYIFFSTSTHNHIEIVFGIVWAAQHSISIDPISAKYPLSYLAVTFNLQLQSS